jgi:hypothetical protein
MKKKRVFIGIAIGAIAGGAFSNVNFNNSHSNNLSDVSLANVEALASEGSGNKDCWDTITTAVAQQVFYCGTCDWIKNSKPSVYSKKKKC